MSSIRRLSGDAGISLVEILVALGIMSAVVGYRSAAVTIAADWARGLEWDSIDGAVGCSADSAGLMAYTRCTTVQTVTGHGRRVPHRATTNLSLLRQGRTGGRAVGR